MNLPEPVSYTHLDVYKRQAVSIAYIGMNNVHDAALASNKVFTLVTVLVIYWLATFISLKGLGWVSKISKIGATVGTIIPVSYTHLDVYKRQDDHHLSRNIRNRKTQQ